MGSLVILAIVVLILHVNEKSQDEIERRKGQHLINFDGESLWHDEKRSLIYFFASFVKTVILLFPVASARKVP